MSATIMMPNTFELSIKSMMEDAVTQAVASLAEKHGFDQEEALRDLNLGDLKLVRKRGPSPKGEKVKGKKAPADKPKTKRGTNGYILFSKEERPSAKAHLESELGEGEKLTPQATITELGARWKALSEEERAVWNAKAKEVNSAATSAASSANVSDDEAEVETKKEVKKEAKKEAAPKEKKKPNGYLSWASENRAAIKAELKAKLADDEKVTGPQFMAAVAAAWKALPEEERAEWNEKAKAVASSDEE